LENLLASLKNIISPDDDNRIYSYIKPDMMEEREGKILLVWGNIPFWTVVDRELFELLNMLDGKRSLIDIIKSIGVGYKQKKELKTALKILVMNKIVVDEGSLSLSAVEENNKFIPIENVALNITKSCNLNCSYCYNHSHSSSNSEVELSEEEIISMLKEIKPMTGSKVTMTVLGGEPLMAAKTLIRISEEAVELGYTVLISTNGTNITEEFLQAARRLKLEIQVSIDGHNAEINDRTRGKGSFERAVNGVRKLVQNKVYTIISMVCHEENFQQLEAFYNFATSLGVNEARFIPLKKIGRAECGVLKPVNMKRLALEAHLLFKKNSKFARLAGRDFFSILRSTCRNSIKRRSCGTGLQTLLIDSDGSLYPCINTACREFNIGNIREEGFDFSLVWANSQILKDYREKTSVDSLQNSCSGCPLRYWCLGCCRGETYTVKGDISTAAYNCDEMKEAIIEMFWILSEKN
jgi:radical SAM protein with 4Fe4S-binding SPASM domain